MAEINMPENYIALFSAPDKETSKQIIKEIELIVRNSTKNCVKIIFSLAPNAFSIF